MKIHLSPQKALFLSVVMVGWIVIGCATLFRGVVTVTEVRDSAMRELATLHARGLIGPNENDRIAKADAKYRAAAAVAVGALESYKNGGSEEDYLNALRAVRDSVGPLLDILAPLTSPEKTANLKHSLSVASKP